MSGHFAYQCPDGSGALCSTDAGGSILNVVRCSKLRHDALPNPPKAEAE